MATLSRPAEADLRQPSMIQLPVEEGQKPTFLHRGQLVILNEGSTTRDYLAFERNYLAWIKLVATCLVISGALIIRLQLNEKNTSRETNTLEDRFAKPFGIIFFAIAMLGLFSATTSFFRTQAHMLRGVALISSGPFVQLTGVIVTLAIGTACVVLIISASETSHGAGF